MTDPTPFEDPLFSEAMDLVIARARSLDDSTARTAREAEEAWSDDDPLRQSILAEAERVWSLSGRLEATSQAAWPLHKKSVRTPRAARNRFVAGAVAALAAVGLVVFVLPDAVHFARGDVVSSAGEIRKLDLADGSRATLAPETVLRVAYSNERRDVILGRGSAFFEVKPDAMRPFTVRAGDLTAQAIGTAYEVEHVAARRTVAVAEGIVSVGRGAGAMDEHLGAGDWLLWAEKTAQPSEHGHRASEDIAPWRDRLIVLNSRPIREAVAEIDRWYGGRILVWDDGIGDKLVSGVFNVSDPQAALRALVEPHGGHMRAIGPWLLMVTSGS
jgi:transmembrane sensor